MRHGIRGHVDNQKSRARRRQQPAGLEQHGGAFHGARHADDADVAGLRDLGRRGNVGSTMGSRERGGDLGTRVAQDQLMPCVDKAFRHRPAHAAKTD